MSSKLKAVLPVLLFAPIWLLLYTVLHEGGHALVILAYGGTIDRFWILGLNAHVSAHGAAYTAFGEALMKAAGVLLPSLVSAIALIFYKPRVKLFAYHLCYFLVIATPVFSMLVWIIFPVISLFTPPPQGEDVTQFLNVAGFHPLFVSLTAFVLAGAFVFFMYKKGLLRKIFGIRKKK
jgi:hypothetical protein